MTGFSGGGVEMTFASPVLGNLKSTSDPLTTFRSPRPAKASNIRVVTRIRPLLNDEVSRGRRAIIAPVLQSVSDAQENIPPPNSQCSTNGLIMPRNSKQYSPSSQYDSNNTSSMKTPSPSLPPKTPATTYFTPVMSTTPETPAVSFAQPTSLLAGDGPTSSKQFDFDAVLGMEATQEQVYASAVGDKIMSNVFRGINFTIMAYGQTAAGKSYTMQGIGNKNSCPGSPTNSNPSESDGIIPRAIHDLFKGKLEYKATGKGNVSIELSYFELYNEEIRDLLAENDSTSNDFLSLKMLDHGDRGVFIEGLTTVPIDSEEHVQNLIAFAAERRVTSTTNANETSSRSHAICTLSVNITPFCKSSRVEMTQAKLTLVDLAGSERIKKTGVVGAQQQESITINKDLFVLGKVVAALADKSRSRSSSKGKQTHVPFRDSKLTRLLRESLGGNCFTVLISCISPSDMDIDESINTLRYAERARSISNAIKRNVSQTMLTPAECAALTAENMKLKAMIMKLKNRVAAEISRTSSGSLLDQEEQDSRHEIFRLRSSQSLDEVQEDAREVSPFERRSDKPIWMHFKDLAKMTKNVALQHQGTRLHQVDSMEVELREASSFGSGSGNNNTNQMAAAESCLSYEMAILSTGTDDLVVENPSKDYSKLKDDYDQLLESLEKLKTEHDSLSMRVAEKQQELRTLQESKQECDDLVATRDALKADADQMQTIIAKMEEDATLLLLGSPQRSFRNIERCFDSSKSGEVSFYLGQESESESDEVGDALSNLESQLVSPGDEKLTIYQMSDRKIEIINSATTTIQTQKKEIADLRYQVTYETEQSLLNERTKCVAESKVAMLQQHTKKLEKQSEQQREEITRLKHDIVKEQEANQKLAIENIGRIEALEHEKASLSSEIKIESEKCKSLEEKINFMYQDYETMASTLHQKISDLQDDASRDSTKNKELEFRIQTLQKTKVDLECKLSAKSLLFEQESLEKTNLKLEVHALTEKIKSLEELPKSVESENTHPCESAQALTNDKGTPQNEESIDGKKQVLSPSAESEASQQHDYIREKASKILKLADAAIENVANGSVTGSSCCSSAATDFRPPSEARNIPNFISDPKSSISNSRLSRQPPMPALSEQVQITNIDVVKGETECTCQSRLFANKKEYVDFYLPKINVDCTCDKMQSPKTPEGAGIEDPTALQAILRPWQVEFLNHAGITDATSFVHTCTHRGHMLATELRRWRRSKRLPSIRTKSCAVALHIWSRTCKCVLRSVREQRANGVEEPLRPEFLELNIAENNTAVSSLGSGPYRMPTSSRVVEKKL